MARHFKTEQTASAGSTTESAVSYGPGAGAAGSGRVDSDSPAGAGSGSPAVASHVGNGGSPVGADGNSPTVGTGERLHAFDAIRGLVICVMVVWHTLWDLRNMYGVQFGDWYLPVMEVTRVLGVALFLLTAGIMCAKSRSNLKRAFIYALVAGAIALVTYNFPVGEPINFGIIYCMAACTFVAWLLEVVHIRPSGYLAALVLLVLYAFFYRLPQGYVGFSLPGVEGLQFKLPRQLFSTPWLAWLGFPGPGFTSGDYFPLLPSLFCYLAGVALGNRFAKRGWPAWTRNLRCAPLEWVGRNSLWIYLAHQPIIVGILSLIFAR